MSIRHPPGGSHIASKRLRLTCCLCDTVMVINKGDAKKGLTDFLLCANCEDFCQDSLYDMEKIANTKKKQPEKFQLLKEQRSQWLRSKEGGAKDFEPHAIYEQVVHSSIMHETYTFISRERFKQMHGLYPDEAKLSQIKVLNRKGVEVPGIGILDSLDPKLTIRTERMLLHRTPVLKPECHLYQAQAEVAAHRDGAFTGHLRCQPGRPSGR